VTELVTHPGAIIAHRYQTLRVIGSGGMATVYLATDRKYDRRVAIKMLRPELTKSVGAERFKREIGILSHLQHPNILPLYDSGEWQDRLYYVMPAVDGESLRDRMARGTRLSASEIADLARQVALALDYAHASGIIHRDVTPANILLTGGTAVVADFGIAHALTSADPHLTDTGITVGTPAYMSPEQSDPHAEAGPASDQYSLGCVIFEVLAGRPPFIGNSGRSIVFQHWHDPTPSLSALQPSISPGVDAIVRRALAKTPADRFPTVAAFADALIAALPPRSGSVPAATGRTRFPRSRAWAVLAAAALLVAVLVSTKGFARSKTQHRGTMNSAADSFFRHAEPFATFKFEESATRTAMRLYEKAVDADPRSALAYAKLAQQRALYFYFFDRTAARRRQLEVAVDSAMALDPSLVDSRIAQGFRDYWGFLDYPRARSELVGVLDEAPDHPELWWLLGSIQRRGAQSQADWEQALQSLRRAASLNPRASLYSLELEQTYVLMRKYDDAESEAKRCMGLDSTWFACYLPQATLQEAGRGDLRASQRVIDEATRRAGPTVILQWLLSSSPSWVLESSGPNLEKELLRLSVGALNSDSAGYYLAVARYVRGHGDSIRARVTFDSARQLLQRHVKGDSLNAESRAALSAAYAGLGRGAEAVREGKRAIELLPVSRDAVHGPPLLQALMDVYLTLGDADHAIDMLEKLLAVPSEMSITCARVDPHFNPIRQNPRFQALIARQP
jgi:tetratricopeptide (TPR) repeat protein/tRNA A-37 threonylcarbamoyl transferase component Bud32